MRKVNISKKNGDLQHSEKHLLPIQIVLQTELAHQK